MQVYSTLQMTPMWMVMRGSGLALVNLSVVEQRYRAVLAVERGEPKIVVVAQIGISRQTLHT